MTIAAAEFGVIGSTKAQFGKTKAVNQSALEAHQTTVAAVQLPIEGELPSLRSATGWLNSPPLTAAGLRGKVVLIEFWTSTCVNWLRTLPYVGA